MKCEECINLMVEDRNDPCIPTCSDDTDKAMRRKKVKVIS